MELPEEQKYVMAGLTDQVDLEKRMHADEGATVAFYGEDDEEPIAHLTYDEDSSTSVREAMVEAVADDAEAAEELREYVEGDEMVRMQMRDDADGATDVDDQHLMEYAVVEGVLDVPDGMEAEYVDTACNHCGHEMDTLRTGYEDDDLDIYMYDCGDCGNDGVYFGGEDHEDGAVAVWAEFTDREDLNREIDIRGGSRIEVYEVPEGAAGKGPGEYMDDGQIFSMELEDDWKTRPDGLVHRLLDRPVPLTDEVRERLEGQMEDPNMGVIIHDPKGGSDVEGREDGSLNYLKRVQDAQVEMGGVQ